MPLYKTDPNDNTKQVPDVTPGGRHRFSYAIAPTVTIIEKRPSYVTINNPGGYAFLYETTASLAGETHLEGYVTASVGSFSGSSMPSFHKLDINPIAWKRTDGTGVTGDITFVYVRVR